MFSKADPHKQLFQLLLAIQGLRKNLLYETTMQMAWESVDILLCHLWFASKLNLRNKRRNLILMTHHYADLGGASDGLEQISHVAESIRSTTLTWKVICHQLGVSALISQMSFRWRHKMLAVFSSYEAKHRPIVKAQFCYLTQDKASFQNMPFAGNSVFTRIFYSRFLRTHRKRKGGH